MGEGEVEEVYVKMAVPLTAENASSQNARRVVGRVLRTGIVESVMVWRCAATAAAGRYDAAGGHGLVKKALGLLFCWDLPIQGWRSLRELIPGYRL